MVRNFLKAATNYKKQITADFLKVEDKDNKESYDYVEFKKNYNLNIFSKNISFNWGSGGFFFSNDEKQAEKDLDQQLTSKKRERWSYVDNHQELHIYEIKKMDLNCTPLYMKAKFYQAKFPNSEKLKTAIDEVKELTTSNHSEAEIVQMDNAITNLMRNNLTVVKPQQDQSLSLSMGVA